MNSKKAKMLISIARSETVGQPDIKYKGIYVNTKYGKRLARFKLGICTRKHYKELKRAYKARWA